MHFLWLIPSFHFHPFSIHLRKSTKNFTLLYFRYFWYLFAINFCMLFFTCMEYSSNEIPNIVYNNSWVYIGNFTNGKFWKMNGSKTLRCRLDGFFSSLFEVFLRSFPLIIIWVKFSVFSHQWFFGGVVLFSMKFWLWKFALKIIVVF